MAGLSLHKTSNENRIELLDFIRGMAIIFVLLHHSGVPHGNWILAFHMPFLFVLSGYTKWMRNKKTDFFSFLRNRIFRLIVPYFMFELLNLVLWRVNVMLFDEYRNISAEIKSILMVINTDEYTGFYGRLWFLPCMFVSDIFFYFIEKYCGKRTWLLWSCAAAMVVFSWVTSNVLTFRLPFTIDIAFMATAFLIAGYAMGDSIDQLMKSKRMCKDGILFVLCLLVMWWCLESGESYCWMYINEYGNYFYTILSAICGVTAFFIFTKWLYYAVRKFKIVMAPVLWYSYNSLATFPVHLTIKILVLYHAPFLCSWKMLFLTMLIFNIPIVHIISNYFPFMLGKFKTAKCFNT